MTASYRIELSTFILLGFCLGLLHNPVFGQGAGGRWCLGRSAGVSFATRPPSAVLTTSALYLPGEGGASIADAAGNLLFYTDGTQIFTKNHTVMSGSTNLGGHVSSSQSALIVRQPGSERFYWVFTTDAIESYPSSHQGLRYTVVDVQAAAGQGAIVTGQKSVPLATTTTEKLTACAAANGSDQWIISHEFGTARFMAWKLTASGLASTTPVYSTAGVSHGTTGSGNYNPGRGCMKASPDGSLLATAILPPLNDRYVAELFRFDNTTGQVSLLANLSEPANGANDYNYYGIEFSPAASKLYISTRKGPYNILQYDLCAANIAASRMVVGSSTNQFGTLQLGPDGRIYAAKNSDTYLGVVQNPEEQGGASTYRDQGLNLTGRTSTYGLNNLSASLFYHSRLAVTGASGCQGQTLGFAAQTQSCGVARAPQLTYSWNFADPASGASNTAAGLTAGHSFSRSGSFRVMLTGIWGDVRDTSSTLVLVEAKPVGAVAALDSNWCQGSRAVTIRLQGQPNSTPVVWAQAGGAAAEVQTTPGQATVRTSGNGNAWLRYVVRSTGGCAGDTQRIAWQVNQRPAPPVIGPADLCAGQALPTYTVQPAGSYRFVLDAAAATLPTPSYTPSSLTSGTHTLHIAGGSDAVARVCYTDGPDLTLTVRENAALKATAWDSAYCPDAPESRYALDLAPALADSARWSLTGPFTTTENAKAAKAVTWQGAGHVRVTAQTTPGCPPQTLESEVRERCLEVMNVVTANEDGKNDHFYIRNLESYAGASVTLYTSHGRTVLHTQATRNTDFASADLPAGTYYYLVTYKAGGADRLKRGWVEVVRE